jgi:hypothetical protein
MRRVLILPAISLLLSACASAPTPAPSSAAAPSALERLPAVEGLRYTDMRLRPILADLKAHPEWLDEPIGNPEVLALVPSIDRMCLALRGTDAGDIFVSILPDAPWEVQSVAIDRGDQGREITYDSTGMADDICPFVVFGRRDEFPLSEDAIEVTGSVGGDEARAIARAAFLEPEVLGLDRHGVPAIVVGDRSLPEPEGWRCRHAVVYVGGPRSEVVIGTRPSPIGGWDVTARLVSGDPPPIKPPITGFESLEDRC